MRLIRPRCRGLAHTIVAAFVAAAELSACSATLRSSAPATVTVAAIQFHSVMGAVEENRAGLSALLEEAANHGARILVLPEAAITGYLSEHLNTTWHLPGYPLDPRFGPMDPLPHAETVPGPSTEHFAALARRLGVYVTVPLLEIERRAESGSSVTSRLFNTVVLVSPRGEIAAHYRKLAPWPPAEQSWATPGDRGVQVYDTEYGRVGLAICFDIHDILEKYEPYRLWALLYSVAWVDDAHPAEWFWHELPNRAVPLHHYVIAANWSLPAERLRSNRSFATQWYGHGFSTIISPAGEVLATAKRLYGSDIVYATIETEPGGSR